MAERRVVISIEQAQAEDAAWEAKDSTCRACPKGCPSCNKDPDCECYEHDEPEPSSIEEMRATETHLSCYRRPHPVIAGSWVKIRHSGTYAECLTCIPRTTGRSLPTYRR